jgi:hypothetical protein
MPETIFSDTLTTVMDSRGPIHPKLVDVALHYGFGVQAHCPYLSAVPSKRIASGLAVRFPSQDVDRLTSTLMRTRPNNGETL